MAQTMFRKIIFIFIVFIGLCGFVTQEIPETIGQPLDERQAQESLPQAKDDMWKKLSQCKVVLDHKTYKYSIYYTPQLEAKKGKKITISGFMLPLEANEKFKHFLLSKRTPTCSFCPPGEPNEIIEVFTKNPITWDEGIVTMTGEFVFANKDELGIFFQLKDAYQEKP